MFFSKKRLTIMLSLACLVISVIEYVPYHLFLIGGSTAAEITYLLISGTVDLLLPVIFSTVILALSAERKRGLLLVDCLLLSLPRAAYFAPYFYMELFAVGMEVTEAVLLSILIGLSLSLGFGAFLLLLYGASTLSYRKICKQFKKMSAPSLSLMLKDGGAFDFSRPSARIIAPSSIIAFIVSLPIVGTVEFFVNYGASFVFTEILSIILEVALLLIIFVASHALAVKFAGKIVSEN